jgi:Glycosyltransferase 61
MINNMTMTSDFPDFLSSNMNFLKIKKVLYEYEDVFLCPRSGCVFNKDLEPIRETLHEYLYWNPSTLQMIGVNEEELNKEITRRENEFLIPLQKKVDVDKQINNILNLGDKITGIHLLSGFGFYPYGHFLDYLQKLFVIDKRKYSGRLILHSRSYSTNNFYDHFNACGISNDMLFECRHDFPTIFVKKLVYVAPFYPTTLTHETSEWIVEKYINYFSTSGYAKFIKSKDKDQNFLLFLDRHKVRPGSRSIINYDEILEWVKSKGFIILDGSETIAEIVLYFSQAKFIFGAHGSLFANNIFAPKDCIIAEFCSSKRIDKTFANKHKRCLNYNHLISEADDNNNVFIDIKSLESYLHSSES